MNAGVIDDSLAVTHPNESAVLRPFGRSAMSKILQPLDCSQAPLSWFEAGH